jgi:hypothetical protein
MSEWVYDGAVRDMDGVKKPADFTSVVGSDDSSYHLGRLAGDRP